MRRIGRFLLAWSLLCSPCLNQSTTALAADWFVSPSLELSEEYNSNVTFSQTEKINDFITRVRPKFQGNRETETSKLMFDAALNGEKYVLNPGFDTVEGNVNASWTQGWNERFQTRVATTLAHDETLETELERAGLVEDRVERYRSALSLGATYALSERWSLGSTVGCNYNDYPGGENPNLLTLFASLNPGWQWDERNTLGSSLAYTYASYEGATIDRTLSATLNWARRLAETRTLKLEGGYRYTTLGSELFSFRLFIRPDGTIGRLKVKDGQHVTDSGFVGSIGLDQAWTDRFKTTFSVGQEHYNAADGSSTDRSYARTLSTFQVTEKTAFSCELGYDLSSVTGTSGGDEHLLRAAPVLSYRLTEYTSLRFGTSYEHVQDDQDVDSHSRNRVKVWAGLTVDWPRLWASY